MLNLPATLQDIKITSLPDNAFYISDFITPEEEQFLLHKITSQPQYKWTYLRNRTLQAHPRALSEGGELCKEPLPDWLEQPLVSRLLDLKLSPETPGEGLFANSPHQRPNHVLVNGYAMGEGILPHEDGPAYFPLVATVSLGQHAVLDIYKKDNPNLPFDEQPDYRIFQECRSLLITTGSMYKDVWHGIAERTFDEGCDAEGIANWDLLREETRRDCAAKNGTMVRGGTRYSATIRDVVKVKDYSKILPGLSGRKKFWL